MVNEIDLAWLADEIFDGDGDRADQVRNAGLLSAPGVDADGDGKVTAADFVGIALR